MGLPRMEKAVRRWQQIFMATFLIATLGTARTLFADVSPLPVPEQTSLLVDQAAALDETERSALTLRLQMIQDSGRAQVAVLIIPNLHGEALSDYSLRVATSWQLGRKGRDDGLLILLLPSQHQARIEVGYGLEGDIPDARASQWLDDFLPLMNDGQLATALTQLLDHIDAALPAVQAPAAKEDILDQHPEWKLPFVLIVFSPFALFPLFFGRWGVAASAPLLAGFIGGAAWTLWHIQTAIITTAVIGLLLPIMWSLNWLESNHLSTGLRAVKALGNLLAVAAFFSVITLFTGVGLSMVMPNAVWGAALFAGTLALGLAVFLFPGRPAQVLMVILRSLIHFFFVLVMAYVALQDRTAEPGLLALLIAAAFTACVGLSLYLDGRESMAKVQGRSTRRWSHVLVAVALLMVLPIGVLLLIQGLFGGNPDLRMAQASVGGGSIVGALWWAARTGFFAALRLGLGGRFGGGGAGRG